ncbi:hypothetical protein QT937_017250 [Xanthomonas campestris pv. campestris]|uniref:hypothetical protein n=1 Tax=Xanthomonas campestris TaxID=339 RepID=UPI0025A27613|nr:hypothetical protein [Xanthomonas campestris]MDM7697005.1 hypothetical protein [Xanthomonas campestris pv. campestris]
MMLPPNLIDFLQKIINKTNAGELRWNFDPVNSLIFIRDKDFNMDVSYNFNEIKEIGEFSISYQSRESPTYRFFTDQYAEKEYELLQRLFNAAQGSEAAFPF